jgi:hypothetical protein
VIVNSLWASLLMFHLTPANSDFRWDIITMWHSMGIPGKSVVILLLVVSILSVAIMINRALIFSAAHKQSHNS